MIADGNGALRDALFSALSPAESDIARAVSSRSSAERVDALASLVRESLAGSPLCYVDGVLSFFDGMSHVPVSRQMLLVYLANILAGMGVGASDVRKMGDMPLSVIWEKSFRSDPSLVCFTNCVLDLSTGERHPFDPERVVTYRMPYALTDSRPERWISFLDDVLPDRSEQMCLQEFFGLCFLDRRRLSVEKMALFVGGGANGKSVVFDVMKEVLGGSERVGYLSPDQLTDYRQLASLDGKVINFAPDVRRGASFDSALKALASSQEVQAWRLYEGNVTLRCPPLVFALNEMPRFRDVTDAFFRRVLLFSFDVTIPPEKQDRSLARRMIRDELSGIFNWMVEGRNRLVSHGGRFTPCRRMDDAVASLRERVRGEGNPVETYLDSIGLSPYPSRDGQQSERVGAGLIYEGLHGRVSKADITRELDALGVRRTRSREVLYYLYRKNI